MIHIDDKVIGRHIQAGRIQKQMTQSELANRLDASESYVSRIECGRNRVNIERLLEICMILDLPVGNILQECCEYNIQSSIAAHEETIQLQTMLWDEVVSFLGFEPVAPDRKMLNAKEQTYFAFIHPESISFSAQYVVGEENPTYVLYSAQYYSHMDEAYTLLEQTTEGIHETIYNTDVYFSNNFDQSLFAWTNGTATYQLMGSIDYESGIEIIRDMLGGKPHE